MAQHYKTLARVGPTGALELSLEDLRFLIFVLQCVGDLCPIRALLHVGAHTTVDDTIFQLGLGFTAWG